MDDDTSSYLRQGDSRTRGSRGFFQERINSGGLLQLVIPSYNLGMEESARRRHCRYFHGRVPGESNQETGPSLIHIIQDQTRLYIFYPVLINAFEILLFLPVITSPAGPITFRVGPGPLPGRRRKTVSNIGPVISNEM